MPTKLGARIGLVLLTLLILGGLYLLAQWVKPSAQIIVSSETTVVTEPLTEHGLPDYVAEKQRREGAGISREDNGAVSFWQAMGQGSSEDQYWELLCRELGIDPSQHKTGLSDARYSVADEISNWLTGRFLTGWAFGCRQRGFFSLERR